MMIAVVVTPWNLFHHHESHVHDTHFFDDSNGLLSDHVFDECDFCEFVVPHYFEGAVKWEFKAIYIESPLLFIDVSTLQSSVYFSYLLRGPPQLV